MYKRQIQSIKYKNKTYIGRAGVKESDGKIKWYKLNLDDDWFEFQAVPGLKQRIMEASRSNEYVLMEHFQRTKKDQVVQLKYKPKRRGDTSQGHFVGLNSDKDEFVISFSQAKENFSNVIIEEAIRKSTSVRRKFVSIPPGNSTSKQSPPTATNVIVAFCQFDKNICKWASTASALYACGYEKQSLTVFAQSWLNRFDFSWNKFNGMLQKFLPQHHITVKHDVKIDDIFVEDEDILFQVLQLVDSFGNKSHCVTASANTIFDSNKSTAYHSQEKALIDVLQVLHICVPQYMSRESSKFTMLTIHYPS